MQIELALPDAEATRALGAALAACAQRLVVVCLSGQLGAGKTTLVQGMAQALAVKETVNSPTFTMLNEYHSGRLPLYHFDFYRLSEKGVGEGESDLLAVEVGEIIAGEGIVVIEWPEYWRHALPHDCLNVYLTYDGDARRARLEAEGQGSVAVIQQAAQLLIYR